MTRFFVATLVGLFAVLPAASLLAQEADPPTPLELRGLVVTATPVPLPKGALGSHVTVLQGDDLRARGIATVTEALQQRAGISIVRSGSFGALSSLFLRGGESDYVQVMIDGVPINQPGGAVDLAGLTTEAVERIEVVRGPASALNGSDAVAGVVNIITRKGSGGSTPEGTLTVRGGTFDRLDGILEVRGGDERAAYGVSLARYSTDGILELNNEHDNTVLTGTADFRLADRSHAGITARLADRSYHFPTDAAGNPVDANQENFSQESTVGVELDHGLGAPGSEPGSIRLSAHLTLHDLETGVDDAPDGPADTLGFFGFQSLDAIRRTSADLRASWVAAGGMTLAGGAEFEHQRVRSFNESMSPFGSSTGRSENSRSNRAGYLHAVFAAGELDARVGGRVEDNEQFGDFFTWQLGAGWEARPGTRLRASAGRGIKEPTFFEAFTDGFARGNPDLEPERSLSWEVGVEQSIAGVARLEATWFDQSFEDLIQFTSAPPTPDEPNFFNVAEADARGLEVVARALLADVDLSAEWSWLDTEVVDSGFQEGSGATFVEGERLIRRPENQARVSAAGPAGGRLRWHASLGWVDERFDRDFNAFPAEAVTLDAYTTLDVGVEASLVDGRGSRPSIDLLLEADNLTDESYQEAFGFQAPGRAFYVGVRVNAGGG